MSHEISIMVGPGALALIGTGGSMLVSRDQLGDMIEFLVALQDICEPEADLEEPGLEDSFTAHPANGPGCPVSDGPEYAYPEWHTLGRHKNRSYTGTIPHEDAEDDDSDCGSDEGEPDFAKPLCGGGPGCIISDSDYGGEEAGERDEGIAAPIYGLDQTKGPVNESVALRAHMLAQRENRP